MVHAGGDVCVCRVGGCTGFKQGAGGGGGGGYSQVVVNSQ